MQKNLIQPRQSPPVDRIHLTPGNLEALSRRAIELMRRGGLVVYPTDTVYGLGADATNPNAVRAVYRAKERDEGKPISVAVADLVRLRAIAAVNETTEAVLGEMFPGPFTAILPGRGALPHLEREGSIGIRIPGHPFVLRLAQSFPVTCTSANLGGKDSPRRVADVTVEADLVVDGGPCPIGIHSTVVDLTHRAPRIVRRGSGDLGKFRDMMGDADPQPPT